MGCKPLGDIAHSGDRNIKISGDCLCFSTICSLKSTDNSLHFFLFSVLSVTHNTKVESTFLHFNWLQVWLLYFPHLLLATGVSKYKLQDHPMLEKQLLLTILTRCHFWVLCEILSSLTFLCFFCVVAVQTETISMWIPKHLQLEQFS